MTEWHKESAGVLQIGGVMKDDKTCGSMSLTREELLNEVRRLRNWMRYGQGCRLDTGMSRLPWIDRALEGHLAPKIGWELGDDHCFELDWSRCKIGKITVGRYSCGLPDEDGAVMKPDPEGFWVAHPDIGIVLRAQLKQSLLDLQEAEEKEWDELKCAALARIDLLKNFLAPSFGVPLKDE